MHGFRFTMAGLVGAALVAGQSLAAPVAKTQTGQSIMVNLLGAGTYTVVENDTYRYNLNAAAALFSNQWDGAAPTSTCDSSTSGPTTKTEVGPQPVTDPCDPGVTAPGAPAPNSNELLNNAHPGREDVVGANACAFLNGTVLSGATYIQTASASAQCTYVSASTQILNGPDAGKYKITRRTVTKICTYTFTYVIAPLQASYDPFTAWDLSSTVGGGDAQVEIGGIIAGESVLKSNQQPLKFSYSIGGDVDPRDNRVQNLVVTIDGIPYPVGSTVIKNVPGSVATLTSAPGDVVFGADGALDFFYVGNAGSNGVTSLLADGDARTILNTDSFAGNNNGGADGSALALAQMDAVNVALSIGDHTVTLTGVVKDNTASLGDITFSVSQILHIITPGCGDTTVTP